MNWKISKDDLINLLNKISKDKLLIAPLNQGKDVMFCEINDPSDIPLDYANTVKPPKEFFLAQQETILSFGKKPSAYIDDRKKVLFGIRPCDLSGIISMDNTFREIVEDTNYLSKRANTLIIALACTKACDENAFCESMGAGPVAKSGYDIQLIRSGDDSFFASSGSKEGEMIIKENNGLFKKTSETPLDKVDLGVGFDPITLVKKLDDLFDDIEFWEDVSKTCIRCAGCNYLCPSCFCFNVKDTSSERRRGWDSCMLRGFTREASTHIPRNGLYTRFRQRMYHKYKWHYERYDSHMCTGCGRCITYCPGNVPYREIIERIIKDV